MPEYSDLLRQRISLLKQGDPVVLKSYDMDFSDLLTLLHVQGQTTVIDESTYGLFFRYAKNYGPSWIGDDCFVFTFTATVHNIPLPLIFSFKTEGPRKWYFFRTYQYFFRQLTWKESDDLADLLCIPAPIRPDGEAV